MNATGAVNTLWQRRFWEHLICDEGDFGCHIDYIHYNPVKHGLVARPVDWCGSSIHQYIRLARKTAQGIIEDYRQRHPEAIDFDASRKRQVAGKGFQPRYIRSNAYLSDKYQVYVGIPQDLIPHFPGHSHP